MPLMHTFDCKGASTVEETKVNDVNQYGESDYTEIVQDVTTPANVQIDRVSVSFDENGWEEIAEGLWERSAYLTVDLSVEDAEKTPEDVKNILEAIRARVQDQGFPGSFDEGWETLDVTAPDPAPS